MSVTTAPSYTGAARTVSREIWVARIGVLLLVAWLLLSIALPLWTLLSKSFQNANGDFIGLTN
ncbi:MAG TPA: putative 2-aminoethylphosphonate ABC transporter permease subunit, partial [Xanthobacteraceae bacterium]|nr:putative 2-aminoethylphosphonate ABC transporter permease subunit [Xanthobacteraceae bacterium]